MKVNRGSDLLHSCSVGSLDYLLLDALGLHDLSVWDAALGGLFNCSSFGLLFTSLLGHWLLGLGDLRLGGSLGSSWGLSGRRRLGGGWLSLSSFS